jgi:hypothetical protein
MTTSVSARSLPAQRVLSVTAVALLALTLAACGKTDDSRTPGEKLDSAIATTQEKTAEAQADIKDATAEARADASAAVADAKAAGRAAAASVDDAGITVAVNAALAGDPKLSALKIDVDTSKGRVELKGSAPDESSRRRATELAQAVKGVVGVDNRLTLTKG